MLTIVTTHFSFLFMVDLYSSKDHDDENTSIKKEWHSKSVNKNGHTKRFLRCEVWQSGWELLKVTIHSEKPDSKKLVSPPPDDPAPASPSFMSYTQFKFCVVSFVSISSAPACIPTLILLILLGNTASLSIKSLLVMPFGNKTEQDMAVIRLYIRKYLFQNLFFLHASLLGRIGTYAYLHVA